MTTPVSVTTGHVGLNVTDLDRASAFYRDVLDLEELRRSAIAGRAFAFLGRADAIVLTLWQQSDGAFGPDRPGLHHLAFEVESLERVAIVEQRLRARGARIYHDGVVPHAEGAQSGGVFFEDPDGIRLEVFTRHGVTGTAPHVDAPTCGFF